MSRAYLKRGFSLVEVMVVVGILTALTSISAVAYNNYVANSRKVAMKHDLATIHNGYQTFTSHSGNYCYDESVRYRGANNACESIASIYNVGAGSLLVNKKYGASAKKRPNFIGFASHTCANVDVDSNGTADVVIPADDTKLYVHTAPTGNSGACGVAGATAGQRAVLGIGSKTDGSFPGEDTACLLDESKYKIGAFGFLKGKTWMGMNVNHNGFFQVRDDEMATFPTKVPQYYVAGTDNAPCGGAPSP